MSSGYPAGQKADFLCNLARKIETPAEIAAFARELRAKSITPPLDAATRAGTILDVCGTGGDRLNTFNIFDHRGHHLRRRGSDGRQAWQPRGHFASRECGRSGGIGG